LEQASLDHIMAFLVEPIRREELLPTIHLVRRRFEQFQELRSEADSLRTALQERTLIERAKSQLMRQENIEEDAAYQHLRRLATARRVRLVDVARRVLLKKR
jgi:two-component system, response regulator PdtaR